MKPAKKLSLPHLPKVVGPKELWKKLTQKEANERALEPRRLRVLTFTLTFAAMALGLSYIPLFPQPLPVLLAFMVAAVTYGYPEAGMPIGCGVVGLGLMYQLSAMNFVSMLGGDPLGSRGLRCWFGWFCLLFRRLFFIVKRLLWRLIWAYRCDFALF